MDELTKERALDKLTSMASFVAYPDEYLDDNILEEYYGDLVLDTDNLLQSAYNCEFAVNQRWLANYGKIYNGNDWMNHGRIINVNGEYLSYKNAISKLI